MAGESRTTDVNIGHHALDGPAIDAALRRAAPLRPVLGVDGPLTAGPRSVGRLPSGPREARPPTDGRDRQPGGPRRAAVLDSASAAPRARHGQQRCAGRLGIVGLTAASARDAASRAADQLPGRRDHAVRTGDRPLHRRSIRTWPPRRFDDGTAAAHRAFHPDGPNDHRGQRADRRVAAGWHRRNRDGRLRPRDWATGPDVTALVRPGPGAQSSSSSRASQAARRSMAVSKSG